MMTTMTKSTEVTKSPLTDPIIDNDLDCVRQLLSSGVDVNQYHNFHGHAEPGLVTAVRYVRMDMVKELLQCGASVNLSSSRGQTPLIHASERNLFSLMCDLLQQGAKVNATDKTGRTALYWAVKLRNFESIKELIKHGANVNLRIDKDTKQTVLHLAVESPDLTEYLISKGAKVNIADDCGETPLFLAVRHDNIDTVRLLLKKGANVNCMNQDYRTPLHLAAASVNNSLVITELLLDHGAKVRVFDRYLNTPLVLTLRNYILQPNRNAIRCLIKHGSDLRYSRCGEEFEWMISADLELLQLAIAAGLRLNKLKWVHELVTTGVSKKQWQIMGQDDDHGKKVVDFIKTELQKVHSLSALCRIAIREHLIRVGSGFSIKKDIKFLPIPESLKEYLMMTEW